MSIQKTAFITGVTGQDGSYLAKFLLDKGYRVVGMKRRTSLITTDRLDDIEIFNHPNFKLEYGNMTDSSSIYALLTKYKPDEIYNLAAQSHVRVSFEVPEETLDVVGGGTLKLLEAYRLICPQARFYQASSSEMYGDNVNVPQNEETRMTPASPYACAKLYAHNLCRNYREGYGLHISSGILFNHETVAGFMPLIFKEGNSDQIDIKPIQEIVVNHTKKNSKAIDVSLEEYQETKVDNQLYVWDKGGWTKVTYASGYPHKATNYSKAPKFIVAKNGAVFATDTHEHIMENEPDKKFKDVKIGDKISLVGNWPETASTVESITPFEAYMVGYIVGDGNYNKPSTVRITSKTKTSLQTFADYWISIGKPFAYHKSPSGFDPNQNIWHLHLKNAKDWTEKFIPDLYTGDKKKRVPKSILNSRQEIQHEFLKGYNAADGLKKNPCIYKFKNFKTNSATLALGLIYLIGRTTKQDFNVNVVESKKWGQEQFYYSINLLSNSDQSSKNNTLKQQKVLGEIQNGKSLRQIHRETKISRKFIQLVSRGYIPKDIHHLEIEKNVVKKKIEKPFYDGWFFDLETESSTFHCGIGMSHVHNSPVRGETFVTRKITMAAANIKIGRQETLYLGNLEAKRDWGFAGDYVEAMWLMLQKPKGDDYVIATGETHTVEEFLHVVFDYAGLDVKKHVKIDPRLFRPHEVPILLGDSSKAQRVLGWKPKTTFNDLAHMMYDADYHKALNL